MVWEKKKRKTENFILIRHSIAEILHVKVQEISNSGNNFLFVGRQLYWKDHLVFICLAVCTDICMYWCKISSTSKGKLHSLMRTQWLIFVKLGMWVVGGTSTTHVVCHYWMCIFNTSLAYLFWLANNKKVKYPEFCMSYIDETWYVGSEGHKYYPSGLSSLNTHI